MRQVSRPPASVVDRARSEPHRTTIPAIRWENFQLAEVGFFDRRAQDSRAPRGWLAGPSLSLVAQSDSANGRR